MAAIYSIWLQARSVVRIHTHPHNAVPLVWGLLRLAPIIILSSVTIFHVLYILCYVNKLVFNNTLGYIWLRHHRGAVAGLAHYAEISPIMLLIIQAVICFYF